MVDGIGSTGSVRLVPTAPVTGTERTTADTPAPAPTPSASPALGSLARSMAASPPVDKDRVAQIKRAIQTGTFPILPATIADRLMALRLEWNGRDQA